MPDAPSPITSPPAQPYQPYDATDTGTGSAGGWKKIKAGGAANAQGQQAAGDWPDNGASSDGGWQQT